MNNILVELNNIFRDTLDNQSITLNENTTSEEIDEWDSLSHFELVIAVENKFSINIKSREIKDLKTIKNFIDIISLKTKK